MATVPIVIKHGGKTYPLEVNTTWSVPELREKIYGLTRVAPPQQKIMLKGVLKDDVDLSKAGLKPNQQVMLIGSAGEIPKAPTQQTKFLEDMDESELAKALRIPSGLQNLGNTCYMNSTIQVLKQIPELQTALSEYSEGFSASNPERGLVAGLRDLYSGMDRAATDYPPLLFWQMLRAFRPQFDQQDNHGHFAQQDAEECWNSIVVALKDTLGGKFAEKYMSGRLLTTTKSEEAPEEEPTTREEGFYNLTCSISSSTNYLVNGLKDGFTQQLEKNSPSLGRNAIYTSTSTVSRLPAYLTIHLNRFFWRPDIRKKTKIMRRVQFPFELDATELASDDIKTKVKAVNARLKEIEKDRFERMKVAKRSIAQNKGDEGDWKDGEEKKKRAAEAEELEKLIDPSLRQDTGSCTTGLYDLVGLVTHRGSSAEGGHYIGWAKNTEKDNAWYKFDDAKVTVVNEDAISALQGGGEGSSAYLLLYRAKKLD